MTGSWLYGLFESLRKLVNFGYKDVNYGLEMLHLVENLPPGQTELYHLDFSIVMNRIFLEVYKEPQQFWNDILKVLDSYEEIIGKDN